MLSAAPNQEPGRIDRFGRQITAHHVANDFAADPGTCSAPGNGLAIESVDSECDTDDLPVPAAGPEAVPAPAPVPAQSLYAAVVSSLDVVSVKTLQKDALQLHDAVDAFVVGNGGEILNL